MPKTQVMPEFQITQEYLGFSNHLVFLAQMWREVLDSDTYAKGPGSTVTRVADGSLYRQRLTGMAGVANTGSDRNWTGHQFGQANWYAFGRLAWNPNLSPRQIANEWIAMTLTHDPNATQIISHMMLESHDALVDYMTPLGLHHLMWGGHHYGPAPWWDTEPRADCHTVYFHRADDGGIGFDRTAAGSNTLSQYHPPVRDRFANLNTCPEKFLLWFHHVPWDYHLRSGRTLWDELVIHYSQGVQRVSGMRNTWAGLAAFVDPERYAQVSAFLAIQEKEARWWRDASIAYFQTYAHRPLPAGYEPPEHDLQYYESLCFPSVAAAEPRPSCN